MTSKKSQSPASVQLVCFVRHKRPQPIRATLTAASVSMAVMFGSIHVQASSTVGADANQTLKCASNRVTVRSSGLANAAREARACSWRARLGEPRLKFACVWSCDLFCHDAGFTYCCPGHNSCK
jgi:hypothetical protein